MSKFEIRKISFLCAPLLATAGLANASQAATSPNNTAMTNTVEHNA
jgi:hypothetical protein